MTIKVIIKNDDSRENASIMVTDSSNPNWIHELKAQEEQVFYVHSGNSLSVVELKQ